MVCIGYAHLLFLQDLLIITLIEETCVYLWLLLDTKWEIKEEISTKSKKIKQRRRRNSLPNISEKIQEVLHLLEHKVITKIRPARKSSKKGCFNSIYKKRAYIGVSKNGSNWQVLINMGKCKKYIGTFLDEKEAAIAYDFYTICLHQTKAKTNFYYNAELIRQMIDNFLSNTNKFEPMKFINNV